MDKILHKIWYICSVFPVTDDNGKILTVHKKFELIQKLCEGIMGKSKDRPAKEKKKPKKSHPHFNSMVKGLKEVDGWVKKNAKQK